MKASKVFIIAGEPSGDLIGSKLMDELLVKNSNLIIDGVGGTWMEKSGLESFFPMSELSIMGFTEVLPKLPKILLRLHQLANHIIKSQPSVVITIDSPGFNFRLVRMLRRKLGKSIPIINYVAPSIWAYKPERVNIVRELYDHQLLIFPFELPYFIEAGVPATYVGHPMFENMKPPVEFNENKNMTLAVMPGSRVGEIKRHASIFVEACALLKNEFPELRCAIFTLPHLANLVREHFNMDYMEIIDNGAAKEAAWGKCSAALVKSGTSSLEVLARMIPMVVAYRVNWLSAWYIKRKLNIAYVSIANIIAGKCIIPELLQDDCTPQLIYENIRLLLHGGAPRQEALTSYKIVLDNLLKGSANSSRRAAEVILSFIK